ncbi:glycosyl transferase family 4 [Pseudoxanthomonas broegbernensis]|uniref:Glycosyl transferase family 4 n=1 Tax=Pseudoxanthomonas broegbernensis TaxID=83619 RepID=A0A7V8K813_9GAMM|nr:MraY family glycosyltransferase [Pseudoxanthomonas broegbernensis]KAF1687176.1 glycosyl transferase family 4 [Pseudoxanthomonas broegbernensis]MBB6065843.1 UDP-GlcNAc:undecaprenyl-phosphate GlcNAc-1-phosphate transferase [Pseudoxanthomonas broegbernensis]
MLDILKGLDWTAALAALGATFLLQWILQPVATRLKLFDYPRGRRDHAAPTPVTGGLAMGVGVIFVGLLLSPIRGDGFAGFALAACVLLVVGLLDDRYDIRWYWRILAQVTAALIMIYVGGVRVQQLGPVFGLSEMSLGALSVPFTVFATVGLINAINMVDGADGLAGMLVWAALLMLSAAALYAGNELIAERMMILMGAVAAFLAYNLRFPWRPRAKLFMGDAGSAFLGLVIAWFSFRLTQNPGHPVNPVLTLWFVPIPMMDALVLIIRRLRNRQSPFNGDRNHMHHLMLEAGFGPTQAALALTAFTLLCGLTVGQAMRMDVPHPALLGAFVLMCVGWYLLSGRRERAVSFFRRVRAVVHLPFPRRGGGHPEKP